MGDTSYEVRIQGLAKVVYICPRANVTNTKTRIGMLYVTAGEIWYERQLLIHRPCISFKDMRSVDGAEYPTFQETAEASGLVHDQNEVVRCFEDILHISTPAEKRGLFVMFTLEVNKSYRLKVKLPNHFIYPRYIRPSRC